MLSDRARSAAEDPRRTLYIDAKVMAQPRVSGIGHTLRGLVTAMHANDEVRAAYRIKLLAPLDGHAQLRSLNLRHAGVVRLPLPIRGYDRWPGLRVLPPLDTLLGRGVYVFPHYGNWPLRHSPSLTFVHDIAFLRMPHTVGGNLDLLTRNIGRWTQRTTLVVTVSEFSRGEISRYLGIAADRIAVVPWGVDRAVFEPAAQEAIERVRRRHGLPEGYVLYLGNIEPRKNLVRLIEAYRLLPADLRREHPLVLAGGFGWKPSAIERAIAEARDAGARVIRPERYVEDEDLPGLLSAASLLAQPSLYEGFGVAPLQAMACGIPVVMAHNSAQPEVGGDAAVYVDAMDTRDIAAGIESLLVDAGLRARLAARGEARARTLSWDRSVAAMLDALRRATGDAR